MKRTVILGHGSRSQEAKEQFKTVAERVGGHLDQQVDYAFMELAEPNFTDTVARLESEGASKIVIYPLFLFAGIHIKEDIPELIELAQGRYPHVEFEYLEPIGTNDVLVGIIADSLKENKNV